MSIQISRRHALAGLVLGFAFPAAAQARVAAVQPVVFAIEVLDLVWFDPAVRPAPNGEGISFNLAFRTDPQASARLAAQLEELRAQALSQLAVHWSTPAGAHSLLLNNAYVTMQDVAYLSQQNRGRKYDEFGLVVESTHGSWRRSDGAEVVSADYWVTPHGVKWERHARDDRGV